MAEKKLKSVYDDNGMNLQGDITVTLTVQERNMVANALTILSPKECDIVPILMLVNKVVTGK